jgi:UDP:flavonoid glycosyltransferase YjiC (YdhE family)
MRVLFASTRGAGHFSPLVPLARACRRAGHEVLVAGPPALAPAVEAAGFAFWAVDDPPADALAAVWSSVPSLPLEEQNRVVIGEVFGRLNATATLAGHRRACREWRADVVVRESSEYGSALAAELEGIPHARVGFGLASTEELGLGIVAPVLDELRADLGLPPDPEARTLREAPYFTWFPRALEDTGVPVPDHTLRLRDPAWDATARPLAMRWPEADPRSPLVYVTFGSVAGSFPDAVRVFATAMEALAQLPVRCLLTVGRELDLATLPPAPPNVRVERWVPQDEVLPHAAAVVCHGGSGSTLGALAAGRPLVVVPLFADQPYNARRVTASGAGVAAGPEVAALRAAVTGVLEEPAFATAAARIAGELRAQEPPSTAIHALAALVARHRSARLAA